MKKMRKTSQLQIRLTPEQKRYIQQAARAADQDVSAWVLNQLLSTGAKQFMEIISRLCNVRGESLVLAELNDFLTALSKEEFNQAVRELPTPNFSAYLKNQIAAMIEYAAYKKNLDPPAWVNQIEPLAVPNFGSDLISLRLHLLVQAPPPFRRRNIFVDSSIGDRV